MNITIKKFKELSVFELYDIIKLRLSVFAVEQDCVYNDLDDYDKTAYHVICTKDNDEIIGVLRITAKNTRFTDVSIGRIVVDKSYRKQGIGNKIISYALNYIKQNKLCEVARISAQARLQKYYEKFGFITCSKVYLEDNIEHIEMYIDLNKI